MKLYCQKCGSGTAYNMQKPKFCQSCGSSFSASVKKPSSVANKKSRSKTVSPVIEDHEEEEASIPTNINKLEFDMVGSLEVKGTTVATLAGTISPNEKVNTERGSEPQVSKEKFLENFQKEAGTSRPKE